jgi:hypothetical protein
MPIRELLSRQWWPGVAAWLRGMFRPWYPAVLLALPATLPYVVHFAAGGQHLPTGFIQYDQPYYMANAREHFDSGSFSILYGNPFDGSPDTPRVYWQPHIMVLGILLRMTGLSPGMVYLAFGLCALLVCARVSLTMYRATAGGAHSPGLPILVVFFWGGGLLTAGAAALAIPGIVKGAPFAPLDLLRFDPQQGWWFLNLGRNLILPTEAYYHALFFGCIVFLMRRKFLPAALCAATLCASHPFTGVEIVAVLCVWLLTERFAAGAERPPFAFVLSVVLLLIAHISYYLVFLPSVPEHRQLMLQWEEPWILPPWTAFLAYAPVAAIALWNLKKRRFSALHDRTTRLLLVWFGVAFLLANHQLFIRAVQPLHFTRGYIWTPLFLMAAPQLQGFFEKRRKGAKAVITVVTVVALLCADNVIWLSLIGTGQLRTGIRLTRDDSALLEWMNRNGDGRTLVIASSGSLGYMATVYSPVRAWVAHWHNTPWRVRREGDVREFLSTGQGPGEWEGLRLIVVASPGASDRKLGLWSAHGRRAVETRLSLASYDAVLLGPLQKDLHTADDNNR